MYNMSKHKMWPSAGHILIGANADVYKSAKMH